jgi:hypothetical protein
MHLSTLNVVYLFHQIMLIFKIMSGHIDAFVQSWHEFKNSFTLNVGLLSGDETWLNYLINRGRKENKKKEKKRKKKMECSLDH